MATHKILKQKFPWMTCKDQYISKLVPQLEDCRKVMVESVMCVKAYMTAFNCAFTQWPLAKVVICKHLWGNSLENQEFMIRISNVYVLNLKISLR